MRALTALPLCVLAIGALALFERHLVGGGVHPVGGHEELHVEVELVAPRRRSAAQCVALRPLDASAADARSRRPEAPGAGGASRGARREVRAGPNVLPRPDGLAPIERALVTAIRARRGRDR